jgi:hypothetical protein
MFREFETWKCPVAVTITIHEYVFHSSVLHPFPPPGIPEREQKKKLASGTLYGVELVDGVARICCMNMLLHGISGNEAKEVRLIPAAMPMSNHGGKRSASRDACTAGKISQYSGPND